MSVGRGVGAEHRVITAQPWPINGETCSCNMTHWGRMQFSGGSENTQGTYAPICEV